MWWIRTAIDMIFALGLFINAILFIPQAIKLYKSKRSHDLSLLTFIGFAITQLAAIAYGLLKKDIILTLGYLLSLITCGTVIFFIIFYRCKTQKK